MRIYQTWFSTFLLPHAVYHHLFCRANESVNWEIDHLNIKADRDGIVKFAVLGDFGHNEVSSYAPTMAAELNRLCKAGEISFIVSTGDNFYGEVNFNEYWIKRFEITKNSCKWVVIPGNSDYKVLQRFGQSPLQKIEAEREGSSEFPGKWIMPISNFLGKIDAGDSVYEFVFLDTVEVNGQDRKIEEMGQKRIKLLENLKSDKKYIVFGHYPLVSDVQGDLEKKVDFLRTYFDKNSNMLVYCSGHVHALELLIADKVIKGKKNAPRYAQVISGAAGAFLNLKGRDEDYQVTRDGLVAAVPSNSREKRAKTNEMKSEAKSEEKTEKKREKFKGSKRGTGLYAQSENGFVVFNLHTSNHLLDLTYYSFPKGIKTIQTFRFLLGGEERVKQVKL